MRRSPAVLSLFFFQIPIWVFCYCTLTHVFGDWLKKQSRWRSNAHANIRPFYAIYGFDEERLAKVDLDKAWGGQVVLHEIHLGSDGSLFPMSRAPFLPYVRI